MESHCLKQDAFPQTFFFLIIPLLFLISAEMPEGIHESHAKFSSISSNFFKDLSVIEYSDFLIFLRHRKRIPSYTLGFHSRGHFLLIIFIFIILWNLGRLRISRIIKSWFTEAEQFFPQFIPVLSHYTINSKKKSGHTLNSFHGNLNEILKFIAYKFGFPHSYRLQLS